MKRKIFAIAVLLSIILSTLSFTGNVAAQKNYQSMYVDNLEEEVLSRIFIFGIMENMSYTSTTADYEVIRFLYIFENGNFEKRNSGEMIRFHAPMVIVEFGTIVFGYCSDWSIIG